MVCNKLRTAHVTTESIIEEADTNLKNEAQQIQESGGKIPMELWVKMVKNRLSLFDCVKKGWVMDTFPEDREQALALQASGIYPKHVGEFL